ncbi:MAG: iron-containing alcohol dehydrogenase [Oscillospiraceae bacterium]|nr:iron-containing alcohol dehydrogenase [Oscillospiraceae bacterium]
MESFSCKTEIISGVGAIWELSRLHAKRVLVVADPYFEKTDLPEKLRKALQAEAVEFFYRVQPDPTVELSAEGTAAVQAFQPDTVVALGGGSAMDCAKAMAYFSGLPIRLVAIPTTSGSGSEATNFAVLTHNGVKHPLIDPSLQPELAILDGNLLNSLPKSLIADAGFDILAHAAESFVATGAGAISRSLARDAFTTALVYLPPSFHGDTRVRQQVHLAATMAGVAFSQSGLGVCHALAHALGGQFHLPHGRLNAILLPAVMEANQEANPHYADLARGAGLGGTADSMAVRNLKNALRRLRKELQLPATLAQAGVPSQKVRENWAAITQSALSDPCCATNPVRPDKQMVESILEQVTGVG